MDVIILLIGLKIYMTFDYTKVWPHMDAPQNRVKISIFTLKVTLFLMIACDDDAVTRRKLKRGKKGFAIRFIS